MEGSTIVAARRGPTCLLFVAHPWLSPARWKARLGRAASPPPTLVVVNRPAGRDARARVRGPGRAARAARPRGPRAGRRRGGRRWRRLGAPPLDARGRELSAEPHGPPRSERARREASPSPTAPTATTRSCSTASPAARCPRAALEITHVLTDIETLNRGAREAACTRSPPSPSTPGRTWPTSTRSCPAAAASATATARCSWRASRWRPRTSGGATVAVPGTLTTAYLALRLFAPACADARRAVRPDPGGGARGPRGRGADHPRGPAHLRRATACTRSWTSARGGRRETGLPLPLGAQRRPPRPGRPS